MCVGGEGAGIRGDSQGISHRVAHGGELRDSTAESGGMGGGGESYGGGRGAGAGWGGVEKIRQGLPRPEYTANTPAHPPTHPPRLQTVYRGFVLGGCVFVCVCMGVVCCVDEDEVW